MPERTQMNRSLLGKITNVEISGTNCHFQFVKGSYIICAECLFQETYA